MKKIRCYEPIESYFPIRADGWKHTWYFYESEVRDMFLTSFIFREIYERVDKIIPIADITARISKRLRKK